MNNNTSAAIETLLYRNGLSEKDIQDAFALFSGYNIDYADFYFQRSISSARSPKAMCLKKASLRRAITTRT